MTRFYLLTSVLFAALYGVALGVALTRPAVAGPAVCPPCPTVAVPAPVLDDATQAAIKAAQAAIATATAKN